MKGLEDLYRRDPRRVALRIADAIECRELTPEDAARLLEEGDTPPILVIDPGERRQLTEPLPAPLFGGGD